MKPYRLGITLSVSLLLHLLLFIFLFQENNLGFKKGVGEYRIKASFQEISSFDSQNSLPAPQKKKAPKSKSKINKDKKQEISQKESRDKKESKEEVKEEKKEIKPPEKEEQKEKPQDDYSKDMNSLQPLQEKETQKITIPDFKQSLAYQFADASTKKNISEFYGPEFGYLGKEEQEYILNNLAYIGKITQKYLRYPSNAAMLQQGGGNVVEFYLHPNGDISDLKIIKKSGFILLDRNSVKTIEIAYKDYPHPKTKTLIRFYINYFIRYR